MIDLKKNYSTRWLESEFEGQTVEFEIRFLHPNIQEQIEKECTKIGKDGEKKLDQKAVDEKIIDFALVNWKGFSANGKDCDCNLANKKILMANFPDWIQEIMLFSQNWQTFQPDMNSIKKKFEKLIGFKSNGKETQVETVAKDV
ncbi:MAG: hypothetical protein ACE5IR_09515 [bacterium]